MVELYVNDRRVELIDEDFKYTIQCNNVADVRTRQANYTNSFKAPRTAENEIIFNGLGMPSDVSTLPYQKPNTKLFYNGIPIIIKGWLNVKKTDDYYNIYIYDGIIDFFKAIENKTIGNDLDLAEIKHDKSISTIINSFTRNDYKYILADYNGKANIKIGNDTVVNADYLIPSMNVLWLWNKIFEQFNFTYSGNIFQSEDFSNLWITFPKPPPKKQDADTTEELTLFANAERGAYESWDFEHGYKNWETTTETQGNFIDNWKYKVPQSGTYKIKLKASGTCDYITEDHYGNFSASEGSFTFLANNLAIGSDKYNEAQWREFYIELTAGQIIDFRVIDNNEHDYETGSNNFDQDTTSRNLKIKNLGFEIYKSSLGTIDFGEALIDFSIKDFFKEILHRFGLTAIADKHSNNVKFITIKERLKNENIIDWSEKYVQRISEEYTHGNYAQRNYFRHKYNDDNANYNDGYISILNLNLQDTKDLINSKTYSPEKDFSNLQVNQVDSLSVKVYPIWKKEIKEVDDKKEVEYKELSGRYYLIGEINHNGLVSIGSEITQTKQAVNSAPIESFLNKSYKEIVSNYYQEFREILENSRKHTIELNLNTIDLANLKIDGIYYFKQEQQYYFLNKLQFKDKGISTAEFIRIKL